MLDGIEVCPKCYGTLKAGHECGPEVLAKDDLCPKCLIIEREAAKSIFHYARDMVQIQKVMKGDDEMPLTLKAKLVEDILDRRQERILKEMKDGRVKRS